MKILVTGACGRIGSHVVRQLLARGVDVVGIDSVVRTEHLGDLGRNVSLSTVDVQDLAGLLRAVTTHAVNRIVHLAAAIGDQYDTQPWGSYQVNLGGTLNVLEAARLAGVDRVVAASTHNIYPRAEGVYGPPEWRPISEDHPPDPRRPYAVMKLAGEYMGRIYAERMGVDFAAVRFASYYGAERAIRRGNKFPDLLNRFILDAVEGVATVGDARGGPGLRSRLHQGLRPRRDLCDARAQSPRRACVQHWRRPATHAAGGRRRRAPRAAIGPHRGWPGCSRGARWSDAPPTA